uniref:CCHC-type domain-containing protein n=1 Tax=Tanacetum cinerariifolium TaxID=118510 RepID=A0A6L2JVW1_TANCI|nr:hypothetical protein [Tanacetum cinerariifolium]
MSSYNHFGCSCCGGPFNGGNCPSCSSVGSENEFVYDPNPNSFDNPLDFSNQPPQHQYETNSCEFCGNDAHYGYDCQPQDRVCKIKDAFGNKQYKPEDIQELFRKLFNDVQNIPEELAEYINTSSWNRHAFYNNDEDDDEEYTIAITPVLPTVEPDNSLSMGDEHLSTIPEKEDSSVENFVPIPSDSGGISDSMCDVPFRDNSPPLDISKDQFKDFSDSNDDSTSIDDDSFSIDDIDYVEASPPHS